MKCRKCGSENMALRHNPKNPAATDLFCADCGAWQKFANKDDVRKYGTVRDKIVTYEDSAPVTHAKWQVMATSALEIAICSSCKKIFQSYYSQYEYCPRCGAKMDL